MLCDFHSEKGNIRCIDMDETIETNDKNISDPRVEEMMSDADGGPPKKKKKRNSWIWQHFTCKISETDGHEYAHCNYCSK